MRFYKQYFYKKLMTYLAVYIRPDSKLAEIEPLAANVFFKTEQMVVFDPEFRKDKARGLSYINSIEELLEFDADYIMLNGTIHYKRDILALFKQIHGVCTTGTRIVITFYSRLWQPLFRLATRLGLRNKDPEQNWLTKEDVNNLLDLAGFESVIDESRMLMPLYLPFISNFINRYLSPLPFFRLFNMLHIVIARPCIYDGDRQPSVSVIVPARNEAGNIERAVIDTPPMGPYDELVFVEGNSCDDTWEVIQRIQRKYPHKRITVAQQEGMGKGDAVRKGFELAQNEILMILDADLTVAPKSLPQFYDAIVSGKGELINGCRLVYPMEEKAMRFANTVGNKFFAVAFSFVLGQSFKDTLCGTKVITRKNYNKIAAHRSYFGDFDPFGDFDLIFGATRLGLKIREVPVSYGERTYGDTNIQRWKHGVMLLRMLMHAARKIKFI